MTQKKGKIIAKALRFSLSNSLFLALNGAFVFLFACYLYGTEISYGLVFAAFLAAFAVYSLNNITDSKEDAINKAAFKKKAVYYIIPSAAAMVASVVIGLSAGVAATLILVVPLILGFSYSVRISKSVPRLKEIVGVKSIVVAFSWAMTGALLPVTIQAIPVYKEALVFFYIFAQILVNTIVFDALDVRGDRASGIKTVPLALGLEKTKKLLLTINAALVGWLLVCLYGGVFIDNMPTLAFGVAYEFGIIWYFFSKKRCRLHAELAVDGEWVPLVVLMRALVH